MVGIRKVLLERLELVLNNKVPLDDMTDNKKQVGNKMNGFEINTYWEV